MSRRYLLIGASSAIARAAGGQLEKEGHTVIAISRQAAPAVAHEWHQVDGYALQSLPPLDGALDGLVYFPGSIRLTPFARLAEADFLRDMQVNFFGAVAAIQKYLPNLKQSGQASVVLFSSVAAGSGMPFHSSIAAAKSAVEGFTRALAAEMSPLIRVNAIAPSLTDTPLSSGLTGSEEKKAAAEKRNPMRKIGTPEEVAGAVCFLLGGQSSWITGQVLAVDGGMVNLKN